MTNLYFLSNEVEQLYNELINSVNDETGEINVDIANALSVKEAEFDEKAIAVATVSRRFNSQIKLIDEELTRLKLLKDRATSIEQRLKDSLTAACERLGKTNIDGISAKISFKKSTKTIVDNESLLPDEFIKVTMTKKPDLTKIKAVINAGGEVAGAHLETCNNIQIK